MKKVQTIMFPRSFLLPVLGENTNFINAMWLRLDFLYETLMRETRRMKNNNKSYTERIKSSSLADSYRFFDEFRINFLQLLLYKITINMTTYKLIAFNILTIKL